MDINVIEMHFYGIKLCWKKRIIDVDIDFREIPLYLSMQNIRDEDLRESDKKNYCN
jgi:hypothetical protein